MTAAETLFLEPLPPDEAASGEPKPPERQLRIVTEADVRAAQIDVAAHALAKSQAQITSATRELSRIHTSEPYRTKANGEPVNVALYALRRAYYELRLKPATAYRQKALAAQAAAQTALLNLTAGDGELWPEPLA